MTACGLLFLKLLRGNPLVGKGRVGVFVYRYMKASIRISYHVSLDFRYNLLIVC